MRWTGRALTLRVVKKMFRNIRPHQSHSFHEQSTCEHDDNGYKEEIPFVTRVASRLGHWGAPPLLLQSFRLRC